MNKRTTALSATIVLVIAAFLYAALREHGQSPKRAPSPAATSTVPRSPLASADQAIADQHATPWAAGQDSARPPTAPSTVASGRAPAAATFQTSALPPAKQAIADRYARERAAGQYAKRPALTTRTVALGQEFTLRPDERVLMAGTEYSLEFQETDQVVKHPYAFAMGNPSFPVDADEVPLDVVLKNTDGKTYATLVVTSSVDACVAKSGSTASTCLSDLATRTSDTTYCARIDDPGAHDACLESVAAVSGSDAKDICQRVTRPRSYCQLYAPDTWTTLRDTAHGFSLKYPAGWLTASTSGNGSWEIWLHHDIPDYGSSGVDIRMVPADTDFAVYDNTYDEVHLRYDRNANAWMRKNDDAGVFRKSCEDITPIGAQRVPSYSVAERHDPRYVVILKQGLLQLAYAPVEEPPSPDDYALFLKVVGTMTFDSASAPITASCN